MSWRLSREGVGNMSDNKYMLIYVNQNECYTRPRYQNSNPQITSKLHSIFSDHCAKGEYVVVVYW